MSIAYESVAAVRRAVLLRLRILGADPVQGRTSGPMRSGRSRRSSCLGVLAAYFGWFWSDGRQTLPMKTMQIALHRPPATQPAGRGRAFARFAAAAGWRSSRWPPAGIIAAVAAWRVRGCCWRRLAWSSGVLRSRPPGAVRPHRRHAAGARRGRIRPLSAPSLAARSERALTRAPRDRSRSDPHAVDEVAIAPSGRARPPGRARRSRSPGSAR